MAIPTSRTKEKAKIIIDNDLCTGCASCVEVCKDYSLIIKEDKVSINENSIFGCIGCGHCMAICPENAIKILGRFLNPSDLFELPSKETAANYEQILNLYLRRRSIREFKDRPIDSEIIEKIINAAKTSPMGLPPSDVNVLIFDTVEKNRQFVKNFCDYLKKMRWLVSPLFLTLMKPIWGKSNDALFRNFVKPLFKTYIDNMEKGINLVTYDAPLVMYFYGSPYSDPADPIVAATTAMYAGEALGLGTCLLGGIHPLIQNGRNAKKLRDKYGIKFKSKEGLFVIFGYPKVNYKNGINRTFASINFSN